MLLSFISDDLYITSPSIFSVADGYVLVKYCFAVSPVLSLFPLLYAINSSDTSVAVIFPSPFKSPITDIAISIFSPSLLKCSIAPVPTKSSSPKVLPSLSFISIVVAFVSILDLNSCTVVPFCIFVPFLSNEN